MNAEDLKILPHLLSQENAMVFLPVLWRLYRTDGHFRKEMNCCVLWPETFVHGGENDKSFLAIFCVSPVLTRLLSGGKVWTNSISNSQRRR